MLAIQLVLAQRPHVAAGTEGAVAGALDHDGVHMRVIAPRLECQCAGTDHRQIERVECLWAIEHDAPHASVTPGDHGLFVLHAPLRNGARI